MTKESSPKSVLALHLTGLSKVGKAYSPNFLAAKVGILIKVVPESNVIRHSFPRPQTPVDLPLILISSNLIPYMYLNATSYQVMSPVNFALS